MSELKREYQMTDEEEILAFSNVTCGRAHTVRHP